MSEPLFLVDAHLPFRLVERLRERGYDALHTRELPRGNATPDQEICALSLRERRVVVTKDGDFVQDLLLRKEPYKLLLISTGNIRNRDLEELFLRNLPTLASLLRPHLCGAWPGFHHRALLKLPPPPPSYEGRV